MRLVLQDQPTSISSVFFFLKKNVIRTDRLWMILVLDEWIDILSSALSPIRVTKELSNRLSNQRPASGCPYVVEDVCKHLDIRSQNFKQFWSVLFCECKLTLRRLHVLHADEPCSVNTAYELESSVTTSPRSTTRPWYFWNFGFFCRECVCSRAARERTILSDIFTLSTFIDFSGDWAFKWNCLPQGSRQAKFAASCAQNNCLAGFPRFCSLQNERASKITLWSARWQWTSRSECNLT